MRVFNKNYEEQIKSYEEQIKSYEAQIGRQQQFIQDQQSALLTEKRCRQAIQGELNELEEKYALLLRNHISTMEKYVNIISKTLNESEGAR